MEKNVKYLNKLCLNILSLILLFQISLSKEIFNHKIRNLLSASEITLTIKGSGDQYILNNVSFYIDNKNLSFNHIPDQILINGEPKDYTGYMVYNLEKEETIYFIFLKKI